MDDKKILRAIARSANIMSKLPAPTNQTTHDYHREIQRLVLLECFRDERKN